MTDKFEMFRNRLAKVYRHFGRQARRINVSCFRVYDHDLPEFPFCIEIYEGKLYVAEYERRHSFTEEEYEKWLDESMNMVGEIFSVDRDSIFLKRRQVKAGRGGQYRKTAESKSEMVVNENGLKFIVNLSDYLDTGLFLDHRVTRQMVRQEVAAKKVLNLFAYTGSFSVYAAAGGATEVVTVDLSKTYLGWAERNMELNEFSNSVSAANNKYSFVQADVKQYLKSVPADYFDIIILDPPTFSNSQRMDEFLEIQKDHVELINGCLAALEKGGHLYFSTNYKKFQLEVDKIHSPEIKDITRTTTPFDFEGRLNRACFRIAR